MMKLIDIHWGWITPGVGQANRRRQLDLYMDILEARQERGERFFFTQPGWLLDIGQAGAVRRITTTSPEPGKADGPMRPEQLERFRAAVRRGQLVYAAYPYSGAVVEGMVGEAVLKALRLSHELAADHFAMAPEGFFVHDGPFQLDWNATMVPQIGILAGFTHICGKNLAIIESPDGSRLPMLGQPANGTDLLYTGTEAPHLPVHMNELRERFGELACATAAEVEALLTDPTLPVVSSQAVRTKGWYGGAPLVMQQQAALHRADLALGVLAFNQVLRGDATDLDDYWKRSLVLQDCHLQWLLADVDAHYLPLARELETEVRQRLSLAPASCTPSHAFNPLPHRHSGVIRSGDTYLACTDVAPASTVSVATVADDVVRATPSMLENNRIRVELSPMGEVLAVFDRAGAVLYRGQANQVRHWINRPAQGEFLLRAMNIWEQPFSGSIRLETEVDVPADGAYPLFLDVVRGLAVAVAANGDDWVRVTNAHWGGGLPSGNQEHGYSQTAYLQLRKGKNRIVLHAIADEGFKLRGAVLRLNGRFAELQYWHGCKVLEWALDPFVVEDVHVREQGARATIEFRGRFSTCTATLTVSLDQNNERVDSVLLRHYDDQVYEGMQTPPLPPEVGSYLGSYCERPYVPAFTVEHQTIPQRTAYSSDKPYGFTTAQDSDRSWNNGRFRDLYAGMAPFLGIFTGIAESPAGSLAMLTDGHGHFFRRRPRHEQVETLGLSLGSTIIHPMTQNYRMPKGSYWEKIGRGAGGVDYDDSHERFDFICPKGDIACSWSLLFCADAQFDRKHCHEQLLESLFPLQGTNAPVIRDFQLTGDGICLAAMERRESHVVLRLVNLGDKAENFELTLPWPVTALEVTSEMSIAHLQTSAQTVAGRLPPHALREFVIILEKPAKAEEKTTITEVFPATPLDQS